MRYRLLGRTGLRVSELYLGAMSFTAEDGGEGTTPGEARKMLDAYSEAGGNVVDTASAYGESEEVLGGLLEGRRDRYVLASKYTISRDGTDPNAAGGHRKNLVLSLERSLRRLRTDYIDLYWVHVRDRHTPVEETMRALDDAVRAGKILYVGISNTPAWVVSRANTLAEWRGWTPFAGIQVPYSLLQRDVERELLPMAEETGLSVAAYQPLAGGVLSGKYTRPGDAPPGSRIAPDSVTPRDHATAQAVVEVAAELGAAPSQVALAWLRQRSPAVHPVVGARDTAQLRQNLGAVDVVLPGEALGRLSAAAEFSPGYPNETIEQSEASTWVFGSAFTGVDGRG
ncbi:aldo/keto reductase [Streptomonospora alba]|uniref:Aldo/keto reductase n=1 Tax=Streptomonospora alba TaxID=183763 RepID=A0A0C2GAR5_9ACTN|nr:aldo/keto reductase [Streptomonospora alba]KII00494.1 aldo/keto reductase [Streptomonospora alba]